MKKHDLAIVFFHALRACGTSLRLRVQIGVKDPDVVIAGELELQLVGFEQGDRDGLGDCGAGDGVLAQNGAVVPQDRQGGISVGVIAERQRVMLALQVERDRTNTKSRPTGVALEPMGAGNA